MRFTLCMRYRKYLRWDLRSACIIVKIYAPKNVICFTQIFSFMDPYSINSFFVQCFFTSLVFYGMNVSAWRRQVCKFQIIRLYIHRSADKILESTSRCEPCGSTILKVENWEEYIMDKFIKLRRHASLVHFAKIHLG